MKNMYAIKCIYKTSLYNLLDNSKIDYVDSYEERVLLVKANSFEIAEKKAEKIALEYEDEYINPYGELVKTTLYEILDIFELLDSSIKNGVEVYSNIFYCSEDQLKRSLAVNHPIRRKNVNPKRFFNVEFNGFDESIDENTRNLVIEKLNEME